MDLIRLSSILAPEKISSMRSLAVGINTDWGFYEGKCRYELVTTAVRRLSKFQHLAACVDIGIFDTQTARNHDSLNAAVLRQLRPFGEMNLRSVHTEAYNSGQPRMLVSVGDSRLQGLRDRCRVWRKCY